MPHWKYGEYRDEVSHAAAQFQFLEESLKMYVANCFEIIRRRVGKDLPFGYTYKDVRKLPLGKLIRRFEKYNTNTDLIKELKQLPDLRNDIAHQAYLLTSEQMNDEAFLSREIERIKEVSAKADAAVRALIEESKKLSTFE